MRFLRTRPTLVALFVLALGLAVTALSLTVKNRGREAAHASNLASTAYTMVSTETFFPKQGEPLLRNVKTRYQKSDGSFKTVVQVYNTDGTLKQTNQLIGVVDHGVFSIAGDERKLIFQSQHGHQFHHLNEEAMKQNTATYLGERTILGFRCLGQRDPEDTETYLSPVLAFPLREVITDEKGQLVTAAVKIDLGEPADFVLPDYPVDYGYYEKRIAALEKAGRHDLADEMRRIKEASKYQLGIR